MLSFECKKMSDSVSIDVSDSISPEPRSQQKRPALQLALKQQAKRRRRNTRIAAQGNINCNPPFPRVIVKVLPPRIEESHLEKIPEAAEVVHEESIFQKDAVLSNTPPLVQQQQTTMKEVLASIPGFKTTKRTTRNLSAAAQIQRTREGRVDLQNPSSILVQANLRGILNEHTFATLPPLYQNKLIQLLPEVDRCPELDTKLSSTSLSNEFFSRACQKWRERLASGEFTPEFQQKIRAEAERDKGKLDPWKIKHFEPFWGCRSDSGSSSSAQEVVSTVPSISSLSLASQHPRAGGSMVSKKRIATSPGPEEEERKESDVPKKPRIASRRFGRKKVKRRKPVKKIVFVSSYDSEKTEDDTDHASTVFSGLVPTVSNPADEGPMETPEPEIAEPADLSQDSAESNEDEDDDGGMEGDCAGEEAEVCSLRPSEESDVGEPSGSQSLPETSDEHLTEISGCLDDPMSMSGQMDSGMEQDGDAELCWKSSPVGEIRVPALPEGEVEIMLAEQDVEETVIKQEEEKIRQVEETVIETEKDMIDMLGTSTTADLHSVCVQNEMTFEHSGAVVMDVPSTAMEKINDEAESLKAMEDLLANNVGQFVQEDSSPEDFYQNERLTEALELLRDINVEEEKTSASAAALLSQPAESIVEAINPMHSSSLSFTSSEPEIIVPKVEPRDVKSPQQHTPAVSPPQQQTAAASIPSPVVQQEVTPPTTTATTTTTLVEQAPVTVQQSTTVTLTLPFLPLNLPLTLPISLPPGTTLVVSDPSTLMGIRPSLSAAAGSTVDSLVKTHAMTSLTPIAPNKLRASAPSPSRILPRSAQTLNTSPALSPATSSSGTIAAQTSARNAAAKQSPQPTKAPPGTVNLERSYRICQAVIENSPNCEQLKAQLRPPSAFVPNGPPPGITALSGATASVSSGSQRAVGGKSTSRSCSLSRSNKKAAVDGNKSSLPTSVSSPSILVTTTGHGIDPQSVKASASVQQSRQQLICIAPSPETPSKATTPMPQTGRQSTQPQQQLRPASTSPKSAAFPSTSSLQPAVSAATHSTSYQQQPCQFQNNVSYPNAATGNNWNQPNLVPKQTSQQQVQQQQSKLLPSTDARVSFSNTQQVYANNQQIKTMSGSQHHLQSAMEQQQQVTVLRSRSSSNTFTTTSVRPHLVTMSQSIPPETCFTPNVIFYHYFIIYPLL